MYSFIFILLNHYCDKCFYILSLEVIQKFFKTYITVFFPLLLSDWLFVLGELPRPLLPPDSIQRRSGHVHHHQGSGNRKQYLTCEQNKSV